MYARRDPSFREPMTRETHGHRLAEWADLVGGSVPDAVAEGDESPRPVWDDDVERR